jgi:ribulose-bisphosphate carboxylase small chain
MMTNPGQRLTQGQFSFLPDLSDAQIAAQIDYALGRGWSIGIEYTDDPHPRNTYWEMFGNPMFDLRDAAGIVQHIAECRKTFPNHYVRVTSFDATRGWETPRMSYLVHRPAREPGFGLARTEVEGRRIRYRISSYATDRPEGERYGD